MSKKLLLLLLLFIFVFSIAKAAKPRIYLSGQCLMRGAAGIWWDDKASKSDVKSYEIKRSINGKDFELVEVVSADKREYIDRHNIVDPQQVIYYLVKRISPKSHLIQKSAKIAVSNNANLVPDPSFEAEKIGNKYTVALKSVACKNRAVILGVSKGGHSSEQAYKLSPPSGGAIVRLQSQWYRITPNSDYYVAAWSKCEKGGVASVGGRILNADWKKCKGARVPYFQSQKVKQDGDWNLWRGFNRKTYKDACWIQFWALGWNTKGISYFDDIQIIDRKIKRLSETNVRKLLKNSEEGLEKLDAQNKAEQSKLIATVTELDKKIRVTEGKSIKQYMMEIAEYDRNICKLQSLNQDTMLLQLK